MAVRLAGIEMSTAARVESFDALRRFRVALCKIAETIATCLAEAEAELQRTASWLTLEQHRYWKREGEKRAEAYTRAKSLLTRKKADKTVLQTSMSCVEEEKALALATRRLQEAQEKSANVKRWTRLLDQEAFAYKTVAQGLEQLVTVDVQVALAHLDNMLAALEQYAQVGGPAAQASVAPGADAEPSAEPTAYASVARPEAPGEAAPSTGAAEVAHLPDRQRRDAVAIQSLPADLRDVLAAFEVSAGVHEQSGPPQPPAAADKVILARAIDSRQRVCLARRGDVSPGDSGWYIGPVAEAPGELVAVSVAEVVTAQPGLATLLQLPAGCVVLFEAGRCTRVETEGRACGPPSVALDRSEPK